MKNQIRTAVAMLGFAGLFCGATMRAEELNSEVANIPFAFQVGSVALPAGTYAAVKINSSGVIRMQNKATGRSVMAAAFVPTDGKAGESKLAFRCYDHRCFLSEIWYADEANGHALKQSARERELVASHAEPQLTYVAMR